MTDAIPMAILNHPGFEHIIGALQNPCVTDLLINSVHDWFVDEGDGLRVIEHPTLTNQQLTELACELIGMADRHLDVANPIADVALTPDEFPHMNDLKITRIRAHAVLRSAVSESTRISLRVHRAKHQSLSELFDANFCSQSQYHQLRNLVTSRSNLAISGASGVGKTTLLRALLAESPNLRTVVVEDTSELLPMAGHVIGLQTRQPNVEGRGEVGLERLLRESLRMRADRLVVGEVRGAEVQTLLQALNTGHQGSMFTIHANRASEVKNRMLGMWLSGGGQESEFRLLTETAIDAIVHLARVGNQRQVSEIQVLK